MTAVILESSEPESSRASILGGEIDRVRGLGSSRPECHDCKQTWKWPRNVSFMRIAKVPKNVKPMTKSTLVCLVNAVPCNGPPIPVIPEKVFRQVELVENTELASNMDCLLGKDNSYYKLVESFHYNTSTGDVYGKGEVKAARKKEEARKRTKDKLPAGAPDTESETQPMTELERDQLLLEKGLQADDIEFATLVTLPSWYKQLFKCLRDVSLGVLDHYSNFLMVVGILTGSDETLRFFTTSRFFCAYGWLGSIVLSLGAAYYSSKEEWKMTSGRSHADIPVMGSWFDHWHAFAALVCFNFFMVSGDVKNIPMTLHPWKSVQPYAAVKIDGARAYIIGHKSFALFKVMSRKGSFITMFMLQVMKTFMFAFKFYVALHIVSSTSAISLLTSLPSLMIGWATWLNLLWYRHKVHSDLTATVNTNNSNCEMAKKGQPCSKKCKCSDVQRQQADAARRILASEFRESQHAEKMTMSDSECNRCGRNVDDPFAFPAVRVNREGDIAIDDNVQLASNELHDSRFGCLVQKVGKNKLFGTIAGQVKECKDATRAGGSRRYYVERTIPKEDFKDINWHEAIGYSLQWTSIGLRSVEAFSRCRPLLESLADKQPGKLTEKEREVILELAGKPLTRKHRDALLKHGWVIDDMIQHSQLEVIRGWWYDERVLAKVEDVKKAGELLLELGTEGGCQEHYELARTATKDEVRMAQDQLKEAFDHHAIFGHHGIFELNTLGASDQAKDKARVSAHQTAQDLQSQLQQVARVRRIIEKEVPKCKFDDAVVDCLLQQQVVEHIANALEMNLSEDRMVKKCSPFLISASAVNDEEEAQDVCKRLLVRLRSEKKSKKEARHALIEVVDRALSCEIKQRSDRNACNDQGKEKYWSIAKSIFGKAAWFGDTGGDYGGKSSGKGGENDNQNESDSARNWTCMGCNNQNFSSRRVCNTKKCQMPRWKADQESLADHPEGAWLCPGCGNVNYAARPACHTRICQLPHPGHDEKKKMHNRKAEKMLRKAVSDGSLAEVLRKPEQKKWSRWRTSGSSDKEGVRQAAMDWLNGNLTDHFVDLEKGRDYAQTQRDISEAVLSRSCPHYDSGAPSPSRPVGLADGRSSDDSASAAGGSSTVNSKGSKARGENKDETSTTFAKVELMAASDRPDVENQNPRVADESFTPVVPDHVSGERSAAAPGFSLLSVVPQSAAVARSQCGGGDAIGSQASHPPGQVEESM